MDETDPERLRQIFSRAVEDAEWIVNKVFFCTTQRCLYICVKLVWRLMLFFVCISVGQ